MECERQFVDDALDVALIGLNARMMQEYVEFVADHLAVSLQYPKIYNTENPFDWMTLIALKKKKKKRSLIVRSSPFPLSVSYDLY